MKREYFIISFTIYFKVSNRPPHTVGVINGQWLTPDQLDAFRSKLSKEHGVPYNHVAIHAIMREFFKY